MGGGPSRARLPGEHWPAGVSSVDARGQPLGSDPGELPLNGAGPAATSSLSVHVPPLHSLPRALLHKWSSFPREEMTPCLFRLLGRMCPAPWGTFSRHLVQQLRFAPCGLTVL